MVGDELFHIPCLTKAQNSISAISTHSHPEIIGAYTQIRHLKSLAELVFNALNLLLVGSSEENVIHIDGNDNVAIREYRVVGGDGFKVQLLEECRESVISDSGGLL